MRVFNASVIPVLLYGAESWPVLAQDLQRLEVFQNNCLCQILTVRLLDRIPVSVIRKRACHQLSIEQALMKRRLQLFGHVARMETSRLPRRAFLVRQPASWRRRRGGQNKTWLKTVSQDLTRVHPRYSPEDASIDASNRSLWRGLIRDVMMAPKATGRALPYQR